MKILSKLQILSLGILITGAALLFIPPLEFDPHEYPKALFFIIMTAVLTILTLTHWILNNKKTSLKFSIKHAPLEIKLIGLVFLAEILAFIFSQDRTFSLLGAPYRFQGLILELTVIACFLNAVYIFSKTETASHRRLFAWLLIATTIAAFLAILPYFIDIPWFNLSDFQTRAFGTFGNPNYLAVFLIGAIPFFGLFLNNKSQLIKTLIVISLFLSLAALILTGSRSAWIGLILSMLIAAIILIIKKRSYKILIIVLTTILVAAGIFVFQQFHPIQSLTRLSLTEDNMGSLNTRIYLSEAGFKLWLEHPIFGSGQETIAGRIEPYLPEYLKGNYIFYIDRTHNEFLDILVTQGIAGFLAYVIFWGYLIINSIKYYIRSKFTEKITNKFTEKALLFSIISILAIHIYYFMNFTTVSGNILLYLFAGYLAAKNIYVPDRSIFPDRSK